jgi:hypothetical protein
MAAKPSATQGQRVSPAPVENNASSGTSKRDAGIPFEMKLTKSSFRHYFGYDRG